LRGPARRWPTRSASSRFWSCRERARKALGDKFDIKAFHDEVLDSGAIPLDVLEGRIDAWITSQKPTAQ